jgi:hypothetical protein
MRCGELGFQGRAVAVRHLSRFFRFETRSGPEQAPLPAIVAEAAPMGSASQAANDFAVMSPRVGCGTSGLTPAGEMVLAGLADVGYMTSVVAADGQAPHTIDSGVGR